jgi:hypothetical protein
MKILLVIRELSVSDLLFTCMIVSYDICQIPEEYSGCVQEGESCTRKCQCTKRVPLNLEDSSYG